MSFTCTPITPYRSYTIPPFSRFDVPATGRAPFGPDDVVPKDLPVDAEVKVVGRMRGAGAILSSFARCLAAGNADDSASQALGEATAGDGPDGDEAAAAPGGCASTPEVLKQEQTPTSARITVDKGRRQLDVVEQCRQLDAVNRCTSSSTETPARLKTMSSIIEKIKSYDLPPELREAINKQNDLLLAKCARPTACRAAPPAAFTPQLARAQALIRRGPAQGRRWRPQQADTGVPGIGALQRERAGIAAVEVRQRGEHEGKVP